MIRATIGRLATGLWMLAVTAMLFALGGTSATAQSGYQIRPGDVLRVEVVEDDTLNREVLVLPDGSVSVPLAGSVRAGGRNTTQVESLLSAALAPNFANPPTVSVSVSRLAEPRIPTGPAVPQTVDVYVLGEANKPGRLAVEPGSSVLQVFAEMGGFTNFAATKRVQLRRTDPRTGVEKIYTLNYDAIQSGQSPNGRTTVLEGDVIVIPQRRLFE